MSTESVPTPEAPVIPPNPHPATVQPAPVVPHPVAAPAPVQPTLVAAATLTPPPAPTAVAVPMEEFLRFQEDRRIRLEQAAVQERLEREAAEAKAHHLAKTGEWEKGFAKQKEDYQSQLTKAEQNLAVTEARVKKYVTDSHLAMAMNGYEFTSPAAAQQFANLIRNELIAESQGDSYVVRTPTFESPAQLVATKRQHPDYLHFFKASTQGGTQGGPSSAAVQPPAPAQPEPPPQPKNFGEAIMFDIQAMRRGIGNGDPRLSPNMSMIRGIPGAR